MVVFNEGIVEEIVNEYLPRTTWLIKTSKRKVKLHIEKLFVASNGFLAFLRIGNSLYQLPLICSDNKPIGLIGEKKYFILKNSLYCIEAEYSRNYFEFMNEIGIDYTEYNRIDTGSVYSEPLTLDSRNAVGLHVLSNGSRLVVKGYRLLDNVILEPLIYEKLFRGKFRHMPRLYRIYYSTLNSFRKYLSLVSEYVEGRSIGETYSNYLKNSLKPGSTSGSQSIDLSIMSIRLGCVTADLHYRLNNIESNNVFGLGIVSESDINKWIERIEKRYRIVLGEVMEKLNKSKDTEKNILQFFFREMESKENTIIDYVKEVFDKFYIDYYKGRIHQDLVLDRFKFLEETGDFRIIDFEGERFRSVDEVLSKEPLVRDLATLANSIYSIGILTHHELHGERGLLKNVLKIYKQKVPYIWLWSIRKSIHLIYGYAGLLSNTGLREKLLKYNSSTKRGVSLRTHYHILLTPWIIDRALYETIYKIQTSSFDYIVSIAALLKPIFPITGIS